MFYDYNIISKYTDKNKLKSFLTKINIMPYHGEIFKQQIDLKGYGQGKGYTTKKNEICYKINIITIHI